MYQNSVNGAELVILGRLFVTIATVNEVLIAARKFKDVRNTILLLSDCYYHRYGANKHTFV